MNTPYIKPIFTLLLLSGLSACSGTQTPSPDPQKTQPEIQNSLLNQNPLNNNLQKDKAFTSLIEQKAEQGDTKFQGVMALMKYKGCATCTPNATEALQWAQKSANQNNPLGLYVLGKLHQEGKVIEKDDKKAFDLFTKSAESGFSDAYVALGETSLRGKGIPANVEQARTWFEKAFAKENVQAAYYLGSFYDNGLGVTKNLERAEEYYKFAALRKDVVSQVFLGQLYTNASQKDFGRAYGWLLIAHDNREKMVNYFDTEDDFKTVKAFPQMLKTSLEKKMSPEEMKQAHRHAKEFLSEIQKTSQNKKE